MNPRKTIASFLAIRGGVKDKAEERVCEKTAKTKIAAQLCAIAALVVAVAWSPKSVSPWRQPAGKKSTGEERKFV